MWPVITEGTERDTDPERIGGRKGGAGRAKDRWRQVRQVRLPPDQHPSPEIPLEEPAENWTGARRVWKEVEEEHEEVNEAWLVEPREGVEKKNHIPHPTNAPTEAKHPEKKTHVEHDRENKMK